ncbi:MAG: autotransporter-associated beta strand repeat-containing protein [Lentisphaerae bacterium]|nr:autotransporter-associated beta strand repeat-containing protein [Lentisphaerota bacterium]
MQRAYRRFSRRTFAPLHGVVAHVRHPVGRFSSVRLCRALSLTLMLAMAPLAQAGNTWDGGGGDDNWGTGGNWNPDGSPTPGSANDLHFAGGTRLAPFNNYADWDDWQSFYFDSGASSFTISGNSIDWFGKVENASANAQALNLANLSMKNNGELNPVSGDLSIGGGNNIYNDNNNDLNVWGNNGHTLTLGKTFNGNASASLIVQQNSTVQITVSQSYQGTTEINAGSVRIAEGVTLNGGTIYVGNGAATTVDAELLITDANGGSTVDETVTVNPGDGTYLNRTVGGSNTSGVNTYSGTIGRDSDGDNETVTLTAASGGTVEYTGSVAGDDAVWVTGGGVTRFGTTAKTYTGNTIVTNSSTLRLNNSNVVSDSSDVLLDAGTTFDLNFNDETVASVSGAGNVTLGSGQLIVDHTTSRTLGGAISGTGNVVKKGTATWTLTGTNAWSGGTFAVGGTLQFNTNQAASFSGSLFVGEVSGGADATLAIGGGGVTLTNAVVVRAGSTGTKTLAGNNTAGTATFSGPVTLSNNVTLAASSGGTLNFTNAIVGAGAIYTNTASGAGTVVFGGAGNNANVALTASAGTVILGKTSSAAVHALDAGLTVSGALVQIGGSGRDNIATNAAVTVNSGRLDVSGRTNAWDAFNGSGGAITNSTGTSLLIVGSAGGGGTYAGQIVSGGGTIALMKFGTNALTLSGNNSYGGGTTMASNGGRLNLGHASALGTGTLFIGGTGNTFDNTSGGALTIANDLSLTNGSPTFAGSNPLTITGTTTINTADRTLTVTASTLTLSGPVRELNNPRQLGKTGAGGMLVLNAAAGPWTGGMQLNSGPLGIGHDGALGTGTFTLSGGSFQAVGGHRALANVTVLAANVGLGGSSNVTFTSSGTFTFSGVNRTLTVTNTGSTVLSGPVYLSDDNTSAGRAHTLAGTGPVTINAAIANNNAGNTMPVSIIQNHTGTVIFNGTNTYSGLTTVNAGTLQIQADQGAAFSSAGIEVGATTGSAGATLAIGTAAVTVTNAITVRSGSSGTKVLAATNTAGTATFSGPVTLNSAVTLAANSGGALTLSGTLANNGSNVTATTTGTIALNGVVSGGGRLIKQGTGTVALGANHTYTGNTEIDLGTVSVTGDIATGSTTYIGNGAAGGAATLALGANGVDLGGTVQVNVDPGTAARTITSTAGSGTTTLSGSVLANTNVTLTATAGSTLLLSGTLKLDNALNADAAVTGDVTLGGLIDVTSGASEINYGGGGTLTISGNNASEPYMLNIGGGTVFLNHASALGSTASYADKINFGTAASTLRVGASMAHATMGMRIAGVSPTFQIDPGVTFSVGGAVDRTSGAATITKSGTGTLVFTGAGANNDVALLVGAGMFQGTGIGGNLTVNSGGAINPGSSPGTMEAGNAEWGTNGVYVWEVNDFAGTYGADPGWDKLNVATNLSVTATTTPGEQFTIRLTTLSGAVAGSAAHFTNTMPYTIHIATAASISSFAADKFTLDTSGFANPTNNGVWSITNTATTIDLVFSPPGGPVLSAGPDRTFTTMLGSVPATQTFGVTNAGLGTLTYTNTLTYGTGASGWVSIAPAPSPLGPGASLSHTVTVSVVGQAGTFHATNTITGNQTNSDQTVVFTLTVTNLPPPTAATATADGHELVRLSWTKAPGLDTLILASTNSIATDPTPGASYAAGATIAGATVIYKGSGSVLEHVVPPGRTNVYRFYAVNNDYYSTNAVEASAVTGVYRAGEIVEPFAYTNGVALSGLNGGSGFSGAWVVGAQGTKLVETNYLAATVPIFPTIANYPARTANRLHFTDPGNGSTNRAERSFATVSTGQVYAAAMLAYRWKGVNKWCGLSLMSNTTEKVFAGKIGHGTKEYVLGLDGVGGQTVSSPEYDVMPFGESPGGTNKVYLVMVRYDFTSRRVQVKAYDPTQTVPRTEPGTWDATDTLAAGDIVTLDGVRVHAGSADLINTIGDSYFDEVRVATNWYELLGETGPVLDVAPAALTFTANLGQNPVVTEQTFTVSNLNSGAFAFTNLITYGAGATGWLAVTPGTGSLSGVSGSIQTAAVAGATFTLSRGTYTATNTVYAGAGGTQAVVVTLSVTGYSGRVVYEPFDTATSGVLDGTGGGFGWNNNWAHNAGSPEPFYNGSAGIADFGDYCSSDGQVRINSWEGGGSAFREAYREFTPFTNGVLYFATKINIGNTGINREAGMKLTDGAFDKLHIGKVVATDGTGFLSALYPNGQNYVSAYALNSGVDYLLVGRYDFAARHLRVKGFASGSPPGSSEPAPWDIDVTSTEGISAINRASLYTRAVDPDNPGIVLWDDVRLATTWNDLMCDLGRPQGYPVVSNATFHAVDSTNSISDAQLSSGNFPVSVAFYDRFGIRADSVATPFFRPNFDLVNDAGGLIVQDRYFDTTNFSADATVMVGSNATLNPVTVDNIPIGTVTLRWSAINSNEGYRVNAPDREDGSNLTFTVYDEDVLGPTPTLLFVGTAYTLGSVQTNITDADLANTNDFADIAVRWDDPSGVFMTNSPPFGNTNIGSENGRVIPNWDLLTSNTITHATNVFGYDQVFTEFVGDNGALSVTTYYHNAFAITNIDFNYVFYLTASAEDNDNDRGMTFDVDGDPVPRDRTVITNALSFLGVTDDDSTPPTATSLRIFGNSRGTGLVTGAELGAGGWSITGRVQDAYSGLRVNGTSTNVPDNSPFLRLLDPSGAVRLTAMLTNNIANGETNARPFSVTATAVPGGIQGGTWTAQIIMTDTDGDRADDALTSTNSITFEVPTFEWDAGAGVDRDWSNATNWTSNVEPGAIDTAFVNGGYTAVVAQAGERALSLLVGDNGFDSGADGGTGTVEQTAGSLGINTTLTLGENPGDLGTYLISGGSLTVTGATTIGSAGIGLMTVTDSGVVTSIGDLAVGAGSMGGAEDLGSTLTVAGGAVVAQSHMYVGFNVGGDGHVAMSGGTLGVTNDIILGFDPGSTGTLTMTAGRLNAGGAGAGEHVFVGSSGYGAMTLSGSATVMVANAKDVVIGEAVNGAGAESTVSVQGGALLAVSRSIEIGASSAARGALQVSGGMVLATNDLNIGSAAGATGTVTVSSGTLQTLGSVVVGRIGQGTLTISGGTVTAAIIRVSDYVSGSVLNLTGGRLATTGNGDFNVDHGGTVNVSGGEMATDGFDLGTNGVSTLNVSGGTITAGAASNAFNVAAGLNVTGIVNQTGGALQLVENQSLNIGSQGTSGSRYGFYSITNGTVSISGAGDINLGDTDSATGRGVLSVLGSAPSVTVGDDLFMSPLNNGELEVTLRDSAIAPISMGNDITLAGTLTVSNIGAVAAGRYVILTNVNAIGNDIVGAFASTNWTGSVTGRVVVSTHDVALLFGPVMAVLGTNTAITIPDGDTTPALDDGTTFSNVVADMVFDHTFTVTNLNATYALDLTNAPAVVVSGSTNFWVVMQPATSNVNPNATTTFTIRFAPDAVGVYTATVSLANNDTPQNPYDFQLAGTGVLAAEPTVPSSNLVFSAVTNTQMTVSWQPGDGANRLLVARVGTNVTSVPLDATVYAADAIHSNGAAIAAGVYAVYNGNGTSVTVTGLMPATPYAFGLFEYNGSNGGINYLTTNALYGTQTTLSFAPVITEGVSVSVTMSENGDPTPFSLTLNATDPDTPYGDVIHWSVLSAPFYGVASANGTGGSVSVSYTPALYYSGSDSFVVQATDNFGNQDTITVQVTITAVNAAGKVFYLFE